MGNKAFFSIALALGAIVVPAMGQDVIVKPARVAITDLEVTSKLEKATYFGIASSSVAPALREQLKLKPGVGVVVDRVEKGSPAEVAGIKLYDVLEKLDDQWLINSEQFAVLVRMQPPGAQIKLSVIRQGQPQMIAATLVEKEVPMMKRPGTGISYDSRTGTIIKQGNGMIELIGPLKSGAGRLTLSGENQMSLTTQQDGQNITVTRNGTDTQLKATGADGGVLYEGPINNDEQWKDVPPDVALKAKQVLGSIDANIANKARLMEQEIKLRRQLEPKAQPAQP